MSVRRKVVPRCDVPTGRDAQFTRPRWFGWGRPSHPGARVQQPKTVEKRERACLAAEPPLVMHCLSERAGSNSNSRMRAPPQQNSRFAPVLVPIAR
jgi:hypothetical protein